MTPHAYALFDTAIGRCAIAWSAQGVVTLQLPEANERETRRAVRQRSPGAGEAVPPPEVQDAIDAIVALLQGRPADLTAVPLDMTGIPAFHQRVYAITRGIAPGATLTYGEIAARLGEPGAARAVGHALGRNPFALIVPCHRVLAAGQRPGGFSAHGGVRTKLRLLTLEGARPGGPDLFEPREARAGDPPDQRPPATHEPVIEEPR
jgi:methylated-DNA-[protein]-cysteine S-methyltransferase